MREKVSICSIETINVALARPIAANYLKKNDLIVTTAIVAICT
jgi:hypothetical protein